MVVGRLSLFARPGSRTNPGPREWGRRRRHRHGCRAWTTRTRPQATRRQRETPSVGLDGPGTGPGQRRKAKASGHADGAEAGEPAAGKTGEGEPDDKQRGTDGSRNQ